MRIPITIPLVDVDHLKTGDLVAISGVIYTGRDAAHKRFIEDMKAGKGLPFDPKNQILYYVGPTPKKPGHVMGSAGPTTATRMDAYTPQLIEQGLKGMIGKGRRSNPVIEAMKTYHAVYFGAVEGTAALLSKCIKEAEVIAYEDLGAESVFRLTIENFPAVVVNDIHGNDLYTQEQQKYRS